jgi:sulfonate transport system permease protein
MSTRALDLGRARRAARERIHVPAAAGLRRFVSPLILLVLWQAASSSGLLSERLIAAPVKIAATAVDLIEAGTWSQRVGLPLGVAG